MKHSEKEELLSINSKLESVITGSRPYTLGSNILGSIEKFSLDIMGTLNLGDFVFISKAGSRLFGTETPASDHDFVVLFKPSLDSLILKKDQSVIDTVLTVEDDVIVDISATKVNKPANTNKNIDLKFISVYKFFSLLGNGDINAIDLFFSMYASFNKNEDMTSGAQLIVSNKDALLTNQYLNMISFIYRQIDLYQAKGDRYASAVKLYEVLEKLQGSSLKDLESQILEIPYMSKKDGIFLLLERQFSEKLKAGYVLKGIRRIRDMYGSRSERAADMSGVDYKAISHALRAVEETEELMSTGIITFPLKSAEEIRRVKGGDISEKELPLLITNLLDKYDSLKKVAEKLVKSPKLQDKKEIDLLLLELYGF